MMSTMNVLITGAGRGLGRALVEYFIRANPHTVVVACCRDPDNVEPYFDLDDPRNTQSFFHRIILVRADNADEDITREGIEEAKRRGVDILHVVIANAAFSGNSKRTLLETDPAELEDMIMTNGIGVLTMFRLTLPLLSHDISPVFVNMGSETGSMAKVAEQKDVLLGGLGASKALSHYITARLAVEHPWMAIFSICPGPVATDGYYQLAGDEQQHQATEPCKSAEQIHDLIKHVAGLKRDYRRCYNGKLVSSVTAEPIAF